LRIEVTVWVCGVVAHFNKTLDGTVTVGFACYIIYFNTAFALPLCIGGAFGWKDRELGRQVYFERNNLRYEEGLIDGSLHFGLEILSHLCAVQGLKGKQMLPLHFERQGINAKRRKPGVRASIAKVSETEATTPTTEGPPPPHFFPSRPCC
jgi:hypothetical protein